MPKSANTQIAVIIDIGKNSFDVVGRYTRFDRAAPEMVARSDRSGANLPPCLIGMEASSVRSLHCWRSSSWAPRLDRFDREATPKVSQDRPRDRRTGEGRHGLAACIPLLGGRQGYPTDSVRVSPDRKTRNNAARSYAAVPLIGRASRPFGARPKE
jgi:hypothetical protein